MRIAFIYDAIYPWVTGGAQKRVWELARRLADEHEVHWYGQKYWDGADIQTREGVSLHGVCQPKELYKDDRRSISQALYFSAHLLPALVGKKYDIIDCQEFPYFPCFVSKLSTIIGSGTLFVTWYEVWDDYWFEYLGTLGYAGKWIEQRVAGLDATHVATSLMTKHKLENLGGEEIHVSPLGIDFDTLSSIEQADTNIDYLFGGRLIPEKNAQLFVEAIAELNADENATNALIIGEGPERQAVEDKIMEHGLAESIEVMDFVEHDDFLAYLKAADVFAFPSVREGFGLVALEALATGTPVVTSNHPQNAAQELITAGETGYLCDSDPADLAAKLQRAVTIDSTTCKQFARRYDWDKIAEEMEDYYRSSL